MSNSTRPKLAAIVTTFFKYSHGQHIVDRFLDGYGWNGTHHYPPMDLVSLYVDQVGSSDVSRERASRHTGMKTYPSIAEALTAGGSKLAVDGVVLVGEHGNYPRNEKGQTKYPRYEFFEQIVKVYRDSGRAVPTFSDKHLSWYWEWARKMYDTSRDLGFAFMAAPQCEQGSWARIGKRRHASLRRHYPHQVRRVFLTRQTTRQDPQRAMRTLLELCDNCKFRIS